MPRTVNVNTLFQLSVNVFVEHFYVKGFAENSAESASKRLLRENIPTVLTDIIVSGILQVCVQKCKQSREDIFPQNDVWVVPHILDSITSPHLTSLDLKPLIALGEVHDFVLTHFETRFVSSLSVLTNLVKLSLATHGRKSTLPICTDPILMTVSTNCKKLQSLDVSHSYFVTDLGLKYLIPSSDTGGCPLLEDLFLFECSVSTSCVSIILENLPRIKLIGYRETGAVLLQLYERIKDNKKKLNLTHVNHVGTSSQTCRNVHKLHFSEKLMFATQVLCPNLQHLKIRVTDHDVGKLQAFTALKTIEFVFNTGTPSGPGNGTIHYLQHYGRQLTSVAIVCNFFNEKFFKIIGDSCHNIKHLWIRCNDLSCYYKENSSPVSDENVYTQLETLYLRVGETEFSQCVLPVNILTYVLGNTCTLKDFRLLVRSELVTDVWLSQLWKNITTDKLEKLLIVLPAQNFQGGAIDLSMSSVHMILNSCPNLRKLGNLLVWNVSYKDYEDLVTKLRSNNYDVDIAFRTMVVK